MNLAALAVLILLAGISASAEPASALVGDYVEGRTNEVYTCGCMYSGEGLLSGRDAILAWNIRDGYFEGTPLAGTKVAAVIVGQTNLNLANPRRSILFLDSPAEGAQQVVLNLFSRRFGNLLGEILAVRNAPISFQLNEERAEVQFAGAKLVVRKAVLPEDAHPGSYPWYAPFVPMPSSNLGVTVQNEYWDEGFQHRWRLGYPPSITSFFGSFALADR